MTSRLGTVLDSLYTKGFDLPVKSADQALSTLQRTVTPTVLAHSLHYERGIQKLSCRDVREFYHDLLAYLHSQWLRWCTRHKIKMKSRCLGMSYLRWASRATARLLTKPGALMCHPKFLELRDRLVHRCQPDRECPDPAWLINKYGLQDLDDNDPRWEVLCDKATTTNKTINAIARVL